MGAVNARFHDHAVDAPCPRGDGEFPVRDVRVERHGFGRQRIEAQAAQEIDPLFQRDQRPAVFHPRSDLRDGRSAHRCVARSHKEYIVPVQVYTAHPVGRQDAQRHLVVLVHQMPQAADSHRSRFRAADHRDAREARRRERPAAHIVAGGIAARQRVDIHAVLLCNPFHQGVNLILRH